MTTVNELADELIDVVLDMFPVGASVLGFRDREDRLTDFTVAGDHALASRSTDIANRAAGIDPSTVDTEEAITLAVIKQQGGMFADLAKTGAVEYTVCDTLSSPIVDLFGMLPNVPLMEPAHAEGYLARLTKIPAMLEAIADRHRAGVAAGLLPVRPLAEGAVSHVDRYLAAPQSDPLSRAEPAADSGIDVRAFQAERDRLLAELVRPAMARYRDVVTTEVVPHGRPADRPGLSYLPGGEERYARLVRAHTTTERTPDELHQTGLDVLAQLADEYAEVGAQVFGTSDFAKIRTRLRDDPTLRWNNGEELLKAAQEAIARAEIEAPRWFGLLPDHSCLVLPVPESEAPGVAGAFYMPPAVDGSRPGTYFANTYKAQDRDRPTSEPTAFHEGVPGHHFQMTIATGLTDLPVLRRLAFVNAYTEGWGLYSERLADEMGLYSGPVDRLGMLAADSIRAARLVVDTGLHAKGWTRQQVLDFLAAHTLMPDVEIISETDRYIAEPGQALAYMVGRLEIQRIRAEATRVLGERFDIKAFHDTVLGHGPLPLSVLAGVVGTWAAAANV